MGAVEGKPRSGTPLLDAELEKKRVAAAAAYSKDRKQIIGAVVYVLIYTCVILTLLIMIYIEKQKPCQCQV